MLVELCVKLESLNSTLSYSFVAPENAAPVPYYAIPSKIAVNMIMAGASGGVAAVCIGTWAQVMLTLMAVQALSGFRVELIFMVCSTVPGVNQ